MKKYAYIFLIVFFCFSVVAFAKNDKTLNGTWCVGEDGFILTFEGKDTLKVSSLSDESISGTGVYQKNDSAFTATIINGDVEMKMGYDYLWAGSDTVKAKAKFFTINGESVAYPEDWMWMTKCNLGKAKSSK